MKNITELRKKLAKNFEAMESKTMTLKTGKELANMAGKIINSCKVELEYNAYMDIKTKIPFLEYAEKSTKI